MSRDLYTQEWDTLQTHFEQYEKGALLIKLAAVALSLTAWLCDLRALETAALLAILWLQEGIWRTSQARLGTHLLRIENAIKTGDATEVPPFQLHTHWQANRPSTLGLLAEYSAHALRPTVAYPYAVLLLAVGGLWFVRG